MKNTIYDVAKMAGVSVATVSRVLNRKGQYSKDIEDKVLKIIKKINYRPRKSNSVNFSGHKKVGGVIGLLFCFSDDPEEIHISEQEIKVKKDHFILPELVFNDSKRFESSFYREISNGVIEEGRTHGFTTIIHCINKEKLNDPLLMKTIENDKVDGILLAGEHPSLGISDFVKSSPFPLVLIDIIAGEGALEVTTDNFDGIRQAFEYLFSLGHRQIGFIIGNDIPEYRERYNAYAQMMIENGLLINQSWIYKGVNHVTEVSNWAIEVLKRKERPTAFICSNDFAAIGVLRAALTSGIKVPKELSIIGFDDIETIKYVTPPLTSVRVPKFEIGRISVRELLNIINFKGFSGEFPQCRMRLSPSLIIRDSTSTPS
ncbi:MAG TPA: LacI family DNA-binding transcriptional regulator [Victivallales bacterium]|nr:LacI family DNA-binding transcriptional regulator [Victivallales bacterium]HPO89592.1 LacI family DNA-binding transcriptional regulator [Victivallales bacterium]